MEQGATPNASARKTCTSTPITTAPSSHLSTSATYGFTHHPKTESHPSQSSTYTLRRQRSSPDTPSKNSEHLRTLWRSLAHPRQLPLHYAYSTIQDTLVRPDWFTWRATRPTDTSFRLASHSWGCPSDPLRQCLQQSLIHLPHQKSQ